MLVTVYEVAEGWTAAFLAYTQNSTVKFMFPRVVIIFGHVQGTSLASWKNLGRGTDINSGTALD